MLHTHNLDHLSKYVHKYTNKVIPNKHETTENIFSSTMSKSLNNKTKVQTFSMEINNNHIKQPTRKIN